MSAGKWVVMIALFAIAGVLAVLGVRHRMEKGFLLNNAYLYASQKERETMDRGPYYRQSATVLFLLSAVFAVDGLSLALGNDRFALPVIPLIAAAIVYAAVSSARIRRQAKK